MKFYTPILISLFVGLTTLFGGDDPRHIEVTGSAELEIAPDVIILSISLKQYAEEESMDPVEDQMVEILTNIGISRDDIVLENISNSWYWYKSGYKHKKNLLITLSDYSQIDLILEEIDKDIMSHLRIKELKNDNITEHRKEVKVRALQAAREKAEYLLESIGEEVGDVISIEEIEEERQNRWWGYQSNPLSNAVMSAPDSGSIENTKKIKLRYSFKVKYKIK